MPYFIDSSNISETSEAPLIDSEEVEDVMDTDAGDQIEIEETVDDNVPANDSRDNTEANFVPATSEVESNQPERKVKILICAANQAAAQKCCSQFPKSKIVAPHPSDKVHHFMISTYVNDEYIAKVK